MTSAAAGRSPAPDGGGCAPSAAGVWQLPAEPPTRPSTAAAAARGASVGQGQRVGFSSLLRDRVRQVRVVLVHHKTESTAGRSPVAFVLPYELAVLLHVYMEHAYSVLNTTRSHEYLLMRPAAAGSDDSWCPLTCTQHLNHLWQGVQQRHKAPWPRKFAPSAFRRIHVLARVQTLAEVLASGNEEAQTFRADAAVMTNHVRVWQSSYCGDEQYVSMMCVSACDKLATWRQKHMLARAHAQPRPQPQPQLQPQPQAQGQVAVPAAAQGRGGGGAYVSREAGARGVPHADLEEGGLSEEWSEAGLDDGLAEDEGAGCEWDQAGMNAEGAARGTSGQLEPPASSMFEFESDGDEW